MPRFDVTYPRVCLEFVLRNLTDRQTPLHYASTVELPEMCCLLLESGADPQLADEDGETPASLGALQMAKVGATRLPSLIGAAGGRVRWAVSQLICCVLLTGTARFKVAWFQPSKVYTVSMSKMNEAFTVSKFAFMWGRRVHVHLR